MLRMVSLLAVKAIGLASNSCVGFVPLEVELRHDKHKYVTHFACSNSNESEDEKHNQWNTMLGFCVNYETSQRSTGSSTTRTFADWPSRAASRWTFSLYVNEMPLKQFKVIWAKNTAVLQLEM